MSSATHVFLDAKRTALVAVMSDDEPSADLCVSNVPLFLSVMELLQQFEPLLDNVVSMRVVLGNDGGTYGALLHMCDVRAAALLRKELNLKPISALAKESLFLSFIANGASVVVAANTGDVPSLHGLVSGQTVPFSQLLHVPQLTALALAPACATTSSNSSFSAVTTLRQPSIADLTGNSPLRMRTLSPLMDTSVACTICLESLNEAPTITTVCGHTFHLRCLMKCQDTSCPLCRFDMSLEESRSRCAECSESGEDLWMCLVCGIVLCGRGSNRHAFAHFATTRHTHALQVGSMRVWDYSADMYVHRLVSTEDGGFVATSGGKGMPAFAWADEDDDVERATLESKTEYVSQFYSRLLYQQLEVQAQYYQALIEDAHMKSSGADASKSESVARAKIVAACISGYRQLTAGLRLGVLGECHRLKEGKRRVQDQLEMLAATSSSIGDSIAKLRLLLNTSSAKRSGAADARKKQVKQLTEELELLFASFA